MRTYLIFGIILQFSEFVVFGSTGEKIYINFGACKCDPAWVCPDGRQTVVTSGHQISFERPFVLRGKRNRLCNSISENWRSFVHFSAQNKFCITNLENGKYFYEIVLGDCRFNTFNMLTVNGEVTLTHYQINATPKLFTGMVTVKNKELCLWDPREPLANRNTILEIVDGCGYPQPTRVALVKIVQVTEDKKPKVKPKVRGTKNDTVCDESSCANGDCSVKNDTIHCSCNEGWFGDICDSQCNDTTPCINGECQSVSEGTFTLQTCTCEQSWNGILCNEQCNATCHCDHGTCVTNDDTTKTCKCDLGWSGVLCSTATAVIVREEKVWVKLHGKRVCLTLRKEGTVWRYYITNHKTRQLEVFEPPPGFKWQVYLDGETILIQWAGTAHKPRVNHAHVIKIKLHGKPVKLLLKLVAGKWKPYVQTSEGKWRCFHPPPGFGLTVKIGNDIIRIIPEPTYHKIQIQEAEPPHKIKLHVEEPQHKDEEPQHETTTIYMMRINNKWTPFFKDHHGVLKSYHAPSDHHIIVRIGHEEVDIKQTKPCGMTPCKNGGQCTDEGVTYHCACGAQWSGDTCEEVRADSLCMHETCGGHGACVDLQNRAIQCHCRRGWGGYKCSVPITCPPLACSNGGVMVTLEGDAHCQCPVGYTGRCCQKRVSECSRDPCNKRGLCEQIGVNYACHCNAPYTGRNCEEARRMRLCHIGRRTFRVGQVIEQHCNRCVCLEDGHLVCTKRSCHVQHFVAPRRVHQEVYEGHLCGTHPCVNGHCNSIHYQPRCRCYNGYTGPTCETELIVQQIAPAQHVVHHHVVHQHVVHQHVAEHVVEHFPVAVQREERVHTEITLPHRPVIYQPVTDPCYQTHCGYGSCNLVRQRPYCSCRIGWNGAHCNTRVETLEPDLCAFYSCHHSGSCLVRHHQPFCLCASQFSGDHCEIAYDPCRGVTCAHGACSAGECHCEHGWSGEYCSQYDPCKLVHCEHGHCLVTGLGHTKCYCDPGWAGDTCSVKNPCSGLFCLNGICQLSSGGPKCVCTVGWTGPHCHTRDRCISHNCRHGKCVTDGYRAVCQCYLGYHGDFCEIEIPCHNTHCIHGICAVYNGSAVCRCQHGWRGRNCEKRDRCAGVTCVHGICNFNTGQCHCNEGWTGGFCSEKHPCASYKCAHGRCTIHANTIGCTCDVGWSGDHCDIRDYCATIQCIHGGCVTEDTTAQCRCFAGYTGQSCDVVDVCHDDSCDHGYCVVRHNAAQCKCMHGWIGDLCNQRAPVCWEHDCGKGYCVEVGNEPHCRCPNGWTGYKCRDRVLNVQNEVEDTAMVQHLNVHEAPDYHNHVDHHHVDHHHVDHHHVGHHHAGHHHVDHHHVGHHHAGHHHVGHRTDFQSAPILFGSPTARPSPVCTYKAYYTALTWTEADKSCRSKGHVLASVNKHTQHQITRNIATQIKHMESASGVTMELCHTAHWVHSNRLAKEGNCFALHVEGEHIEHVPCHSRRPFICEGGC